MVIEVSVSVYKVWDKNYLIKLRENRPELLLLRKKWACLPRR